MVLTMKKKAIALIIGTALLQSITYAAPIPAGLYMSTGILTGELNFNNMSLSKGIYYGTDSVYHSSIIISPNSSLSSETSGDASILLGGNAVGTGQNSVAIGTNSTSTLANSIALGSNSVANTASGAIGYLSNGNTSSTWVSTAAAVSVGDVNTGITRQITSVAAGTQDTDAVNVAQLKTVDSKIDNLSTNILSNVSQDIGKVGANAAALAALKPLSYDPYQKFQAMAGYGNYKGTSAIAVGFSYNPNEDIMFNAGATLNSGSHMYNAGVSFRFGKGNEDLRGIPKEYQKQGVISSIYELQKRMDQKDIENVQLKEQNAKMQEQINYLMSKIK